MGRTKKQHEIDVSLTTKEAAYLLMYYLTGVKKEAYIFASKGESLTTNDNSLKSMGAAFHNSNKVKLLEPLIKAKFINQATKALENEGYKVLTPSETIKLAAKQNELKQTGSKQDDKDRLIEELQNEVERLNTEQPIENEFSNLVESDLLDLGDKDVMLKELIRRYSVDGLDEKIKNDISKMIMDVQNMKKSEIQDDKQQKQYYLPLRMCSDCPNLHTLYATNNIKK